jgi:dipeptidyl-peptidase II
MNSVDIGQGINPGYLSVEQALADYASIATGIVDSAGGHYRNCPVIAFGGSYGGMLAAWARLKYPNVFAGIHAPVFDVLMRDGRAFNDHVFVWYRKLGCVCTDRTILWNGIR